MPDSAAAVFASWSCRFFGCGVFDSRSTNASAKWTESTSKRPSRMCPANMEIAVRWSEAGLRLLCLAFLDGCRQAITFAQFVTDADEARRWWRGKQVHRWQSTIVDWKHEHLQVSENDFRVRSYIVMQGAGNDRGDRVDRSLAAFELGRPRRSCKWWCRVSPLAVHQKKRVRLRATKFGQVQKINEPCLRGSTQIVVSSGGRLGNLLGHVGRISCICISSNRNCPVLRQSCPICKSICDISRAARPRSTRQ